MSPWPSISTAELKVSCPVPRRTPSLPGPGLAMRPRLLTVDKFIERVLFRKVPKTISSRGYPGGSSRLLEGDFYVSSHSPVVTVPEPVVQAVEGAPANLTCEVDSNPRAEVLWRKFGGSLPEGAQHRGSVLAIPKVTRPDAGIFQCRADNDVKPAGFGTTTLEVLYLGAGRSFDTAFRRICNAFFCRPPYNQPPREDIPSIKPAPSRICTLFAGVTVLQRARRDKSPAGKGFQASCRSSKYNPADETMDAPSIKPSFESEVSVLYGQEVFRQDCTADGKPQPRCAGSVTTRTACTTTRSPSPPSPTRQRAATSASPPAETSINVIGRRYIYQRHEYVHFICQRHRYTSPANVIQARNLWMNGSSETVRKRIFRGLSSNWRVGKPPTNQTVGRSDMKSNSTMVRSKAHTVDFLKPDVLSDPSTTSLAGGDSIRLTCTIAADPPPDSLVWTFRGPDGEETRYHGGKSGDVTVTTVVTDRIRSVLSIDAAYAWHSGDYTCKATNMFGRNARADVLRSVSTLIIDLDSQRPVGVMERPKGGCKWIPATEG
ncbi:hypothetical protein Bbelb_005590 [Branchiostoma belcheri]|nr:hypothetical protein Bbelb_005590 [Branchiostoma belcheri]